MINLARTQFLEYLSKCIFFFNEDRESLAGFSPGGQLLNVSYCCCSVCFLFCSMKLVIVRVNAGVCVRVRVRVRVRAYV